MDLNYWYSRQQIERMRADAAACISSKLAHGEMAAAYAKLIDAAREKRRAMLLERAEAA